MSGIEVFRVGGDNGATLLIDGTTNSGLLYPRRLRNENGDSVQKVWNADGSLLMIDRRFSVSSDARPAAASYLIDVDGTHGASVPWRVIRASGSTGLGDTGTPWWFWDLLNPLRAYVIRDSGQVDEWWPIGGSGHSTGEINTIRGPVSGSGGFTTGAGRHNLHTDHDGLYYVSQCRRSDGRWGGMRITLASGALGAFVMSPDTGSPGFTDHPDRGSRGTSATGLYTGFSPDGARHRFYNVVTGAFMSDTLDVDGEGVAHGDYARINDVDYYMGGRTKDSGVRMWDIVAGTYRTAAAIPANNPQHISCRGATDRFETYGAAGGGTSGLRYAIWTRANPSSGHPRAVMGIRLGPNDTTVVRYICNHRCVRSSNADECHAQQTTDGRKVVFASNWQEPGMVSDGDVHPYVALIPDAWWSPNNDGS